MNRNISDSDVAGLRMVTKDEFNSIHSNKPHEFDMVPDKYKVTCHPSLQQVVTSEYCEDYKPAEGWPQLDEAHKYDDDKVRMELIPPELLEAVGAILTFGAKKYADRNWEKGMSWSRCFGALMRHMWAWWRGQSLDPETEKSHLWHAACCIAFLIAYEARGSGTDDRPIIKNAS